MMQDRKRLASRSELRCVRYSWRSACTGSTRAARRDGTQAATMAMAHNAAMAAANIQGSRAETWNSMASSRRAANSDPIDAQRGSGKGPARGMPQHQPGNRAGRGAQRHAHADFPCALRHQERDDAIEADGRKQQRPSRRTGPAARR